MSHIIIVRVVQQDDPVEKHRLSNGKNEITMAAMWLQRHPKTSYSYHVVICGCTVVICELHGVKFYRRSICFV